MDGLVGREEGEGEEMEAGWAEASDKREEGEEE